MTLASRIDSYARASWPDEAGRLEEKEKEEEEERMSGAGAVAWVMASREFWSIGEGGMGSYRLEEAEEEAEAEKDIFRFGFVVVAVVVDDDDKDVGGKAVGEYGSLSSGSLFLLLLLLL